MIAEGRVTVRTNAALHRIATNRVSNDPATRDYRDRRIEKGWTVPAVYRRSNEPSLARSSKP